LANKVLCCINLDEDVKLKAHALGINISQATENLLKIMIERMATVDLLEVFPKEENVLTKNTPEVQE
jgi:post-segregation antitoxin (ccd killing protein)